MITPGIYNFVVFRGTTLRKPFIWKPGGTAAVLTGYHAHCEFWKRGVAFTTTPDLSLTDAAGGIFLGTTDGTTVLAGAVTLYMPASQIASSLTEQAYNYGLKVIEPNGDVIALLRGLITLKDSNGNF
jgi:hypothetical protein